MCKVCLLENVLALIICFREVCLLEKCIYKITHWTGVCSSEIYMYLESCV